MSGRTCAGESGIGHMPMLEAPGRSAADYRAFLAGVGAGR